MFFLFSKVYVNLISSNLYTYRYSTFSITVFFTWFVDVYKILHLDCVSSNDTVN